MPTIRFTPWLQGGALFAILLLAWLVYQPGLHGAFLFDDLPNLEFLATFGDQDPWRDTGLLLMQSSSGSLGRPLSMLTFAAQAPSWPHHPADFKTVNLLLHLLNGCLLLWVVVLLGRLLAWDETKAVIVGLATTAIWLIHPLQVSTVMYVVQRMVELSALFTLAGLAAYLRGRIWFLRGRVLAGYAWTTLGVGLALLLGVLAKETALLLSLYLLALELTLLRALPIPPGWRAWRWVFMLGPILTFLAYLAFHIEVAVGGYQIRDFTPTERLMTEARITWEYVAKILVPLPNSLGLFHEDFPVSRGWLIPMTTLPAILAWGLALGIAIWGRVRAPWLSFAVLWFVAGHFMESTFLSLVLYFEHRNYLPMVGVILPLAYGAVIGVQGLRPNARWMARGFLGIWLAFLVLLAWGENKLWGNPLAQAMVWAHYHPTSKFAQSHAAVTLSRHGHYDQATGYYRQLVAADSDQASPYLLWLSGSCAVPEIPPPDLERALAAVAGGLIDTGGVTALNIIIAETREGTCALPLDFVARLVDTVRRNPNNPYASYTQQQYANFLAGQKRYREAVAAGRGLGDFGFAMQRLAWMVMAGEFEQARQESARLHRQLTPLTRPLFESALDQTMEIIEFMDQKSEPLSHANSP